MQPREAVQRIVGEQLTFELKRRLFWREENERCAFGIFFERGADLGEAAEGFAAAGGAEEKSRLHGKILSQRREEAKAQRNFIVNNALEFFISFPEIQFTISAVGKIKLENLCH
jgi:hypothetical protein